ncbi:S8 family serine peptidase [Arthrobacter sp. CAU 1506]|uniref:S8 family serine peptidase n=1 Tax=Arthrobacter sp. CAU 1506 TaxID=2560052 RepID=UPI00145FB19B|nr:S8 family serine peptidase [Arthrobacter sp. CAU 1506]
MLGMFHRLVPAWVVTALTISLLYGSVLPIPAASAADSHPELPNLRTLQSASTEAGGDRFIVKFRETAGASSTERDSSYTEVAADTDVALEELHTTADGARIIESDRELTAVEANELVATLSARPDVEYAEQDVLMYPAYGPNDTYYKQQWSFSNSKAGLALPETWLTTTGKGSVVAVIDTGLTQHSDLKANVLPGADLISDPDISRDGDGRDQDPLDNGDWCDEIGSDSSWHGTHVAGIIAAVAGNGRGVAGAAHGAKVVPVRVLGACGGWMSDIADAIIWAAGGREVDGISPNQSPADVINMSLGGSGPCDSTMQDAINFAVSKGSTVVVAAGNEAEPAADASPANCSNVITVAASGPTGELTDYSNYGSAVDVTAPGGDLRYAAGGIISTVNTGNTVPAGEGYGIMEGTSMSAPHVASIAALMKSANSLLSPAQIETAIKKSARPIAGCFSDCGAGLVSALAAVNSVLPELTSGSPLITGKATVGNALSAKPGTWSPGPIRLSYQWLRNGSPIYRATGTRYSLTSTDVGKSIKVRISGEKSGYKTAVRESAAVRVSAGVLATATPKITGTAKVGKRLTAKAGSWTSGTKLKYQWYRSGKAIKGATSKTYKLVAADRADRIVVKVTGTKAGYATATKASAKTGKVAAGTLKSVKPKISGTAKVGKKLTAKPGTWTSGTKLKYQWYRSGKAIKGASSKTYKLVSADRGHRIRVKVTGTKTGYATTSKVSPKTRKV